MQCATRSALRTHLRTPPERERVWYQGLSMLAIVAESRYGQDLEFGGAPNPSLGPTAI